MTKSVDSSFWKRGSDVSSWDCGEEGAELYFKLSCQSQAEAESNWTGAASEWESKRQKEIDGR